MFLQHAYYGFFIETLAMTETVWLTGPTSSCCSPGWTAAPPGSGSTAAAPGHFHLEKACGGRWILSAGRRPAGRGHGNGSVLPWCRKRTRPGRPGCGAPLCQDESSDDDFSVQRMCSPRKPNITNHYRQGKSKSFKTDVLMLWEFSN